MLRAVGAGQDINSVLSGKADLSAYSFDPNALPAGFNAPEIPEIADYTPQYKSKIDEILANIDSTQPFSYNAATDPSFQAYMGSYQAQGQTAFNNQLGSIAAASGGRVSSWGSSAASQAQNSYIAQGMSALPQFEQAAYSRYRDGITDQYAQAEFLLGLDDHAFQQYQQGVNNDFMTYNAKLDQFSKSLEFKSQEFSDALERTKLNGYVSNEDAIILGVKPGTPSFEAQQAAEAKQTWLEQQKVQMDNEKEMLKIKYDQDVKLAGQRASTAAAKATTKSKTYTTADKTEINKYTKDFTDYIASDEYKMMRDAEKMVYMEDLLAKIYGEVEENYLSEKNAEKILATIMTSPDYVRLMSYNNDEEEARRIK